MDLESIFTEWKERTPHKNQVFITDGPLYPQHWSAADTRIVFLTKEAYDNSDNQATWSLPELVTKHWGGPRGNFWWTIANWESALLGTSINSLSQAPHNDRPVNPLRSTAVVNVKKSGGVSTSNMKDLKLYAERDGDLIKRQIELLSPNVVVCGFTWALVNSLWSHSKISELCYLVRLDGKEVIFIDYWHPANQFPNIVMYNALCAVYQKALVALERD